MSKVVQYTMILRRAWLPPALSCINVAVVESDHGQTTTRMDTQNHVTELAHIATVKIETTPLRPKNLKTLPPRISPLATALSFT